VQVASPSGQVTPLTLDDSDLVWDTDRGFLFANYPPENVNTVPAKAGGRELVLNVDQDEHFMAWMRPFSKPGAPHHLTSRKLSGAHVIRCQDSARSETLLRACEVQRSLSRLA
jgi:hypothetical protein